MSELTDSELDEIEARYADHLDREWEDVRILLCEVRRLKKLQMKSLGVECGCGTSQAR